MAREARIPASSSMRKQELIEALEMHRTSMGGASLGEEEVKLMEDEPDKKKRAEEATVYWTQIEPWMNQLLVNLSEGKLDSKDYVPMKQSFLRCVQKIWEKYLIAKNPPKPQWQSLAAAAFYLVWKVMALDEEFDFPQLDLHDLATNCEALLGACSAERIQALELELSAVTKYIVCPFPKPSSQ